MKTITLNTYDDVSMIDLSYNGQHLERCRCFNDALSTAKWYGVDYYKIDSSKRRILIPSNTVPKFKVLR